MTAYNFGSTVPLFFGGANLSKSRLVSEPTLLGADSNLRQTYCINISRVMCPQNNTGGDERKGQDFPIIERFIKKVNTCNEYRAER